MNHALTDSGDAQDVAMKESQKFDFDCREVISNERVGDIEGKTVFRIIIKLWDSPERLENAIAASGDVQGMEYIRELISQGKSICIEATTTEVISEEWLGIQLS